MTAKAAGLLAQPLGPCWAVRPSRSISGLRYCPSHSPVVIWRSPEMDRE